MTDSKSDIVIIGAGLTGLSLAYYLQKAGRKIILIEKESRVGGVIRSHHEEGFIFESGPNTGVVSNPEVAELFEELHENCSLEIADPKAKNRWIWKKGKWNSLPSGPISAITTPLFTLKDKFRILGEPFRKIGTNPNESVAEMVKRRLGKSFLKYAVDPFVSGIYAGDPEKLITKFALPKLYALEHTYGSFIKGSVKKSKLPKTERDKKASKEVFSAKGGLNNLISALEKNIGEENIILNARDIKVNRKENSYIISVDSESDQFNISSDKIVTACGGNFLSNLFTFINKERFDPIVNLEYAKVVQVIVCYKDWKGIPINAFGGLVPSVEKRDILGILFTSSFFKNRCQQNGAVLSVFMGGMKRPDIIEKTDKEVEKIALDEINKMLKTNDAKPDLIRIFKYQQAIPQYTITSEERFKRISEIESEYPGIILAGNIRNGIGMADRIKQAYDLAESFK